MICVDMLYYDYSRSSFTLVMASIFYPLKLIHSTTLIPIWFVFGLALSNIIGIYIIAFLKCDLVKASNVSYQILYHLVPLYLSVDALKDTSPENEPTAIVYTFILCIYICYDYMLYTFDVLDVYKCDYSSDIALVILFVMDVFTIFIMYILTKIRHYIIKKK